MKNKLRTSEIITLLTVVASIVAGIILYPKLPEQVASHWNSEGAVDGYMSRFWGTFILPIVLAVMWVLYVLIPRIDPKSKNIEKFRKSYDTFMVIIFLLFGYLYSLTTFWNLGNEFHFATYIIPAFSVLFFFIGNMLGKAKSNYSIGIRTPWTLANEEVWDKTHKLGGLLFKIAAIITLIGVLFPNIAYLIFLITILGVTLFLIAYSYYLFSKKD